jgi:putative RecB family exonuclease
LYSRVIDTEHRVQGDRGNYIVEGVIDVLADSDTGSGERNKVEIWDYKGTKRPALDSEDMKTYGYQMLVYAALYKLRNGCYPGSAVLYFMNELNESFSSTPPKARVRIDLDDVSIQKALGEFDGTAAEIISCKDKNNWPAPSPSKMPDIKETCDACDIRWSCPSFQKVRRSLKAQFA